MLNIDEILSRGVAKVLPDKSSLKTLMQRKKIRLYQGFDPTGTRLHLGHTIGLRKLMQFAQLGHEVIFLFGTGTVLVGDPSQRDTARQLITKTEIDQNIKDWQNQVKNIVDFRKIKIMQNGDWLTKLTLKDIVHIASNISAVQLFKRESFQRRLDKGDTVWYHETMYPLLQGYDSVAMDVDLEIGGTDQEFNMLIGRELQHKMNNREKFVLTVPMILGTDGKQMSKTSGNCVWLNDTPEDMFGKLMSIPDEQIRSYWELVTNLPLSDITGDPFTDKKHLAYTIVTDLHSEPAAKKAQAYFAATIQQKQAPKDIDIVKLKSGGHTLLDICVSANLGVSHAQIKRTIEQGGVEWEEKKIINPLQLIEVKTEHVLKFGKRNYKKIVAI